MTALDLGLCYQSLGFTEPPFRMTPDTDFFFSGNQYLEALDHLRFGIASGAFTILTGEVGLGKTLLCRHLLRNAPKNIRFAYLLNPPQSFGEVLTAIHEDLTGVDLEYVSVGRLQRKLTNLLLHLAGRGERVAILIDEAHHLSTKVLEGLRLLSNLDTEKQKLICLLFVGQPELEQKLSAQPLRTLSQRISVRYRLHRMGIRETNNYIRHRLGVAQESQSIHLDCGVMTFTYLFSRGVPRRINQLLDRSLLAAYASGQSVINPWMVWKAAREITR